MRLLIDIFEEDYEGAKQRWARGDSVHKMDYCVSKGISFDSVIEDIKAEIDRKRECVIESDDRTMTNQITDKGFWIQGYCNCFDDVLTIIDKHISGKEQK